MGMPIHAVTLEQAVERVFEAISHGRGGRVLTPNIDILRQYNGSVELREKFEGIELIVTDGMPLVWALRLQRTPVPQRITGTDLLLALAAEASKHDASVLLVGGHHGEAQKAATRLMEIHVGLMAYGESGYIEPHSAVSQRAALSRVVKEAEPDIVFLGVPFVDQVSLMTELRKSMPTTWFIGVGSSFEFVNEVRTRAPHWIQRLGLEWAFRLAQQPRLWRRYLLHGLPFAARLGLHIVAQRLRGSRDSAPRSVAACLDGRSEPPSARAN
jgi:N-acetylglucosaminyldiphosphoundecaprenol N-acetyl-beta-D-mannosaminyltransferase